MRTLRVLIVVLAVSGVIALVAAARSSSQPPVPISSIGPSQNFAYVRIAGLVPDYPSLSTTDGYLSFTLQDSAGQLRVVAYRSAVEALLAQGRLPMPGDVVTVEGSLRVRDDDISLTLNAPEALEIQTSRSTAVELAALDAIAVGRRATFTAQVRDVRDLSPALRRVTLRQGDAEGQMLLPLSLESVFGKCPTLQAGDWLKVTGGVGEYRGQRQVLPARAQDIQPVQSPAVDIRPISALGKSLFGRWVAVQGRVSKLQPVKGGMLLDLKDDGGGAITIAMFDAWSGVPFSSTLGIGDTVTAQGELVLYKGQLEIQPELSADLMRFE